MKEFKDKSKAELTKLVLDKKTALRAFRFGIAGSKIRNVKEGRGLKKDVARILTAMNSTKEVVK